MVHRRTAFVICAALLIGGAPVTAQETLRPAPQGEQPKIEVPCREALVDADRLLAFKACRVEFEGSEVPADLRRQVAELEYEYGDPLRAAALWKTVLDDEGWSVAAARARAMALWRGGDLDATEAAFAEDSENHPSPETASDRLAFLLAFSRWEDAEAVAEKALERFPDACTLAELLGMARAGAGRHADAAEAFETAIDGGCPPFRWTTVGPVPEVLDDPAYSPLLAVERLTAGIRETNDRDCEQRLRLLAMHPDPAAAEAVTGEILFRDKLEVRFAGLGLLTQLGATVMPSWERLLADDDFILRKHTLRRIRELGDPAFIPVLDAHLERESLPGNRNLTALALGQLLLMGDDPARGRDLLESIPGDSDLHAVALVSLADHAEATGDIAGALRLLESAQASGADIHVNPERLEKLRAATHADES
jgi:tetratricopeptide (TPR) repeat protein